MEYEIKRYSLDKKIISNGVLSIIDNGPGTKLIFKDSMIEVHSDDLCHPLMALEKLRITLETEYESIIACNGCRIDTSYRPTGGYGTYKIRAGQQATERLNLFRSTNEIELLCTVEEHTAAYKKWLDSLSGN
jgi:hypothetical protein